MSGVRARSFRGNWSRGPAGVTPGWRSCCPLLNTAEGSRLKLVRVLEVTGRALQDGGALLFPQVMLKVWPGNAYETQGKLPCIFTLAPTDPKTATTSRKPAHDQSSHRACSP